MVPFTIFHRLSSLGSGGGVNAATIPPKHGLWIQSFLLLALLRSSSEVSLVGDGMVGP
jgi:hypothetical protein